MASGCSTGSSSHERWGLRAAQDSLGKRNLGGLLGLGFRFAGVGIGNPRRVLLLGVPLVPGGFHGAGPVGLGGGEVFGFAGVVGQVVELRRGDLVAVRLAGHGVVGFVEALGELPVALANGPLGSETPIERVVRGILVFARQKWQQVDA